MTEPAPAGRSVEKALGGPSPRDLYLAEADYVWTTLRRLGMPAADLADLAHEVFIAAFRKLSSYDASRPVRPWLFGIAANVALQHRRTMGRRREAAEFPSFNVVAADGVKTAEELAVDSQERQLLHAALQRLGADRRAVVILHELDGQPIPVVAEALGIPVNTAYSRLRLGKADLVEAIENLTKTKGR